MREKFQEEIDNLMNQVRNMGVQLEETLDACIDNVAAKDVYVANNIIAKDDIIAYCDILSDNAEHSYLMPCTKDHIKDLKTIEEYFDMMNIDIETLIARLKELVREIA